MGRVKLSIFLIFISMFFITQLAEAKDYMLVCGKQDGVAKVYYIDLEKLVFEGEVVTAWEAELKDEFLNLITAVPLGIVRDSRAFWVSFNDNTIRKYNEYGVPIKTDGNNWFWSTSTTADGIYLTSNRFIYSSSSTNSIYILDRNTGSLIETRPITKDYYPKDPFYDYAPTGISNFLSGDLLCSQKLKKLSNVEYYNRIVWEVNLPFTPTDIEWGYGGGGIRLEMANDLFFTTKEGKIVILKFLKKDANNSLTGNVIDEIEWHDDESGPSLRLDGIGDTFGGSSDCGDYEYVNEIYDYGYRKSMRKIISYDFTDTNNLSDAFSAIWPFGLSIYSSQRGLDGYPEDLGPFYIGDFTTADSVSLSPEDYQKNINSFIYSVFPIEGSNRYFLDVIDYIRPLMQFKTYANIDCNYNKRTDRLHVIDYPMYLFFTHNEFLSPISTPEGLDIFTANLSRVKDIYTNPISFYPSLEGDKDSKTKIRYSTIVKPEKATIQIQNPFTYALIKSISVEESEFKEIAHGKLWDEYETEWDGKDAQGNIVSKGIYSIKMQLKDKAGVILYDSDTSPQLYVYAWAPTIDSSKAMFNYKIWGWGDPLPAIGHVYINIYDDEFRLLKRLLVTNEAKVGEMNAVEWNYSAYAPGGYHYTIWGEDDRGNQAHISGGKFTVPEHIISGTRDIILSVKPGWKREGPIARICRPALVVGTKIGLMSRYSKQLTKDAARWIKQMGYKLYGGDVILLGRERYSDLVHKGLEESGVFYIAVHGSNISLTNISPAEEKAYNLFGIDYWAITDSHFTDDKRLHDEAHATISDPTLWPILVNNSYRFVYLHVCESALDTKWASSFKISGYNHAFLGWKTRFDFPIRSIDKYYMSQKGLSTERWSDNVWYYLMGGKTVKKAMDKADELPESVNVLSTYQPFIYGDENTTVKFK